MPARDGAVGKWWSSARHRSGHSGVPGPTVDRILTTRIVATALLLSALLALITCRGDNTTTSSDEPDRRYEAIAPQVVLVTEELGSGDGTALCAELCVDGGGLNYPRLAPDGSSTTGSPTAHSLLARAHSRYTRTRLYPEVRKLAAPASGAGTGRVSRIVPNRTGDVAPG
ncbi:hypothetical protein [Streptomyces rhizosphaericus]|uniref:Uncharacterized protein n=1 Tax=Streptomyces rhizosphaericus TaxID=114699 RepID=A0A6G4A7I4_9ACTN|nr:hypothetical protein [Streptomyces rhizosphaericus]NEW69255.1 hypothetical protein [Streptomyces rhizosphaericus]